MEQIVVEHVTKEYRIPYKAGGFAGNLRNRIAGRMTTVHAVSDLSFSIEKGEMAGYIGPNGAGKSTTIRLMCGMTAPTSGTITVNGLDPQRDRRRVVSRLGVAFGQLSRLERDLKLGECGERLRRPCCIRRTSCFWTNLPWGWMWTPKRRSAA